MKISRTQTMVECAVMIALATVLSLIKVAELPYGGSVTVASMLPVILISYRHGLRWGLGSGLCYAVIQQLLGLSYLSYVSGWQSIVALILLDYILAFVVTGLGGVFRRAVPGQAGSLVLGTLLVCVLRYICHVISGCTVWAGLSIPTQAALIYSLGYNATYMLPETIVTVLAAFYLGEAVDFTQPIPTRNLHKSIDKTLYGFYAGAGLAVLAALICDVVLIFPALQNAETGEFDFTGFANVAWLPVSIVSAACAVLAAVLVVAGRARAERTNV